MRYFLTPKLSLRGWRSEPDFDLEARRVIEHFDPCAVKTGNGSYQAQSETVSRSIATVFEPIKTLEDLFAFVGRNSRPAVGDRYDWSTVNDFAGNHDVSSRAAVLDGVVHEVGDGIKDQIRIADSEDRAIAGDGKAGTVLLSRGIV